MNPSRQPTGPQPARHALAGALLALALAHAPAALAQGGPPAGGRPPADAAAPPPTAGDAGFSGMEKLYAALALQPAQAAAWSAYVGRVDAYVQLSYRDRPVQATDTAPQQVARVVDRLQNQLAALEDIERAVRGLYEVLSPDQRRQADQLLLASLPPGASGAVVARTADTATRTGGPRPGRGGGGMPPGAGGGF